MTGPASRMRDGLGPRPDLRLGVALALACALHVAAILGIDLPARDSRFSTPALDIRLTLGSAPGSSAEASPVSPQNATREVPASAVSNAGSRMLQEAALAPDAPAPVVAETNGSRALQPADEVPPSPATDGQTARQVPPKTLERTSTYGDNGLSLPGLAKEIASAHTLRERAAAFDSPRTRTKRLTSSSTKSATEAAYLHMWRQKIERIGRANYPPGGISGELLLLAVIHTDGALQEVRTLESSGYPALDEAAMRTVRLAAPFAHFPTEMRKSYDRLEIVRRWRFSREGALLQ